MTNPFLSSPTAMPGKIDDLFGASDMQLTNATKASDDLLQLGNPFADMFGAPQPAAAPNSVPPTANNMWMGNSNGKSLRDFLLKKIEE